MKLTIIQTGEVPLPLRPRFGAYSPMFARMFESAGQAFDYETVAVFDGAPFPDPAALDGILITGSAAGVYDDHFAWMEPLRAFIRAAYAARTPMLGICFGHQIMADALGGDVRKSEKGWGLGRHIYGVTKRPAFLGGDLPELAIACSHQDQVIVAARRGRGLPRLRLHAERRAGLSQRRRDQPPAASRVRRRLHAGAGRAASRQGAGRDDRHGARLGRDALAQPRSCGLPRRVPDAANASAGAPRSRRAAPQAPYPSRSR